MGAVPGETLRTDGDLSINVPNLNLGPIFSLFTAATPDTASNRAFEATAGIDSANEEFEFSVKQLLVRHIHFTRSSSSLSARDELSLLSRAFSATPRRRDL